MQSLRSNNWKSFISAKVAHDNNFCSVLCLVQVLGHREVWVWVLCVHVLKIWTRVRLDDSVGLVLHHWSVCCFATVSRFFLQNLNTAAQWLIALQWFLMCLGEISARFREPGETAASPGHSQSFVETWDLYRIVTFKCNYIRFLPVHPTHCLDTCTNKSLLQQNIPALSCQRVGLQWPTLSYMFMLIC